MLMIGERFPLILAALVKIYLFNRLSRTFYKTPDKLNEIKKNNLKKLKLKLR